MIHEELVEEGIVINSQNGIAEIRLAENESCEECSAKLFCKPGETNTKTIKAFDPYNTRAGESVRISVDGSVILKATILLYGIPLILLILTIWLGLIFLPETTLRELWSFVISLLFLGVYYSGVYYYSKKHKSAFKLARIITVHRHI